MKTYRDAFKMAFISSLVIFTILIVLSYGAGAAIQMIKMLATQ
jgi:hypothetical protein